MTFICGCGHSGTSLMGNMFASHPDVYIPLFETDTFLQPALAREKWKDVWRSAVASGRPHLAEKTPRHVRRIPLIRKIVPGARFVIMVRDGRDVAASFIKRTGDALDGATRWMRDNSVVARQRGAADVYVQRYEDLVEGPREALIAICQFVGLPFREQMLRFHEEERMWFHAPTLRKGSGAQGLEHRDLRNWQINQPLFDGRGAWRQLLGPRELAFFDDERSRYLMRLFGYG